MPFEAAVTFSAAVTFGAPPGTVVEPIRLAFPTAVFRPGDRAGLRARLGLPPDDVLILVSSVIVDGPDKGFADLRAALQAAAKPGWRAWIRGREAAISAVTPRAPAPARWGRVAATRYIV